MSPRVIMDEQETNETAEGRNFDRMPEIQSVPAEDDSLLYENRNHGETRDSKNDYANAFPDWDLLPPHVEVRRVSHRQN